jgi:ribosomal-protein-alanine N-acetyltransferase
MTTRRIALAQCGQTPDFDANAKAIFRWLDEAAQQRVQILCFPETQTVGYRVDITAADAPVPAKQLHDLHGLVAERCGQLGMACILGTEVPSEDNLHDGKPYNSAVVISDKGETLGVHHKSKLTPLDAVAYAAPDDDDNQFTFDLLGIKVGVVICFEGFRFPQTTRRCVAEGAQIVFHPQNNTTRPNAWKIPIHHAMIVTRAAENTVWFASCNCCHLPHQNCRSMIVAPDGQIHARAELRVEQLVVADVDLDLATRAMFNYDMEGCAAMLFADTVSPEEYADAHPKQ